jgi:hypothetical protein
MSSAITIGRPNSFQREPWRLSSALLISAIIHALLLSITLGGQTFGLPGLKFPWMERRLGANDLQILLLPPPPSAPASVLPAAPADIPPPITPATVLPGADKPAVTTGAGAIMSLPVAPTPPAPAPMPSPAPEAATEPAMPAAKMPDIPLPTAPAAPPIVLPTVSDTKQKQQEQEARERANELARLEQERQVAEKLRQSELVAEAEREATRQAQIRLEAARAERGCGREVVLR